MTEAIEPSSEQERMQMSNLRQEACALAKKLSEERGGKPSQYMAEAWATVKGKPLEPKNVLKKFFVVEYKQLRKGKVKTIVQAESAEEAKRMFNDPTQVGLNHEIISCKLAKSIPDGWVLVVPKERGTMNVRAVGEIKIGNADHRIQARYRNKPVEYFLSDVISAYPPPKEAVIQAGSK